MSLFEERLADLPLVVEEYALDGRVRDVSSDFTRKSTVIRRIIGTRGGQRAEGHLSPTPAP